MHHIATEVPSNKGKVPDESHALSHIQWRVLASPGGSKASSRPGRANPLNLILDALYCIDHKTAHFSDTTTTIAAGGYATRSAHLAMGPRASYAWPQRTRATPPIFLVIPII